MNLSLDQIVTHGRAELEQAFLDVSQSRSNYAIDKFVIGGHDTAERRWHQCVIELKSKTFNLRRMLIKKNQLIDKINKMPAGDDKLLAQIDLEEMELNLTADVREWNYLYAMFKSMPPCSYEQFQQAEERYWQLRLTRQAQLDIESTGTIGIGNLDALREAGLAHGFSDRFLRMFQDRLNLPALSALNTDTSNHLLQNK